MTRRTRISRAVALAASALAASAAVAVLAPATAQAGESAAPLTGVAATTTLTFSEGVPDRVTVTWAQVPGQASLRFQGLRLYNEVVDAADATCAAGTCRWSGEVEDVTSGDVVEVDVLQDVGDVDGDGFPDYVRRTGTAALLPADVLPPTISVRIPRRTVRVGRAIRLRVTFRDDQTEVGWTGDECAPGGDCDRPQWYPLMSLDRGRSWHFLRNELYSRRARKVHVWITWPDEAGNVSATYKSRRLRWVKPSS